MRLISNIVIAICVLSAAAIAQDSATRMVAGPSGDGFQVLVSFMSSHDNSFRLQSLIVNVNRVKNKTDQPQWFYADLTSTDTVLDKGEKKQKMLGLRWDETGDVEVKCEGGQWVRQTPGPELDTIVNTIKEVIKETPLVSRSIVEFALPQPLTDKVAAILDSLFTSNLACVRDGK